MKAATPACVAALAQNVYSASTFSPARPPAIPIAVRNPYLSTWLMAGSDGGNGGYLAGEWPTFWAGAVTGWTGLIKVDGINYLWMGEPDVDAATVNQTAFTYTSTRSTFTMNILDTVGMTVEFMSPVLPNDTMRSTIASSYLNVDVFSLDGNTHSVQLYADISAEWISGDRTNIAQWDYGVVAGSTISKRDSEKVLADINVIPSRIEDAHPAGSAHYETYGTKTAVTTTYAAKHSATNDPEPYHWHSHKYPQPHSHAHRPSHYQGSNTTTDTTSTTTVAPTATSTASGVAYHHIFRQSQQLFSEINQQAEWGDWYFATANTAALTFQSDAYDNVRGQFIANGSLANTQDSNYRAINDTFPTFGFAIDLGTVSITPVSTLFTINLMQEEVIQFEGASGNETLAGLWTSYFADGPDAVCFFYDDYSTASTLTTTLDNLVASDSIAAAGQDYLTITSLSVREAFGGLQLAGTSATNYVFMKEISSDGNIQTVDVIFPLHPILLYMNATWLQLLLEPLFINQEANYWPYAFSIHDLGNSYPNATGHNDGVDEMQPLEECGNMIIMALAYAQQANDTAFLTAHYDILRQWNNYLVQEALIPANQISTDDFAGALANQTNLAIKGIIGIAAMAEIANRTGNTADGLNFTAIATDYVSQWQGYAIANTSTPPHTTLNYDNDTSFSLLYNLFADRELGLGLVPQSVYDMQSTFYPTAALQYGVPLDTRHTYTKLDWQILCAAIAEPSTRALFISSLASWINETTTNNPMTDWYEAATGGYPIGGGEFIARPAVGGVFGVLVLEGGA